MYISNIFSTFALETKLSLTLKSIWDWDYGENCKSLLYNIQWNQYEIMSTSDLVVRRCDYEYLFDNGKWYYRKIDTDWTLIAAE